jgi:hypothetical protein
MNTQRAIHLLIYAVVIIWAVLLHLDHQTVYSALLKPLSDVTTAVLTLAMVFDLWIWKWPIFRGWLVKRPIIDGTWKVEMVSDWEDPTTGERAGPITGYMVITQTLSKLTMRQLTKESTSSLVGTEIVCSPEDVYCIGGVYMNKPGAAVRHRSAIHYGAIWLEVSDDDPASMAGQYWTDRKTGGPLKLTHRIKKKVKSFEGAAALYS